MQTSNISKYKFIMLSIFEFLFATIYFVYFKKPCFGDISETSCNILVEVIYTCGNRYYWNTHSVWRMKKYYQ